MSKGICFKEALFHATVEGRKTQTRRICAKHPINKFSVLAEVECGEPRCQVGEKVYLKEPYCFERSFFGEYSVGVRYKYANDPLQGDKWKNKLFMPAKFARYFIEITGVRCERLQDISDEDCMKEGIMQSVYEYSDGKRTDLYGLKDRFDIAELTPREAYAALINSISGRGTWESNPYVFVYDYKLVKR